MDLRQKVLDLLTLSKEGGDLHPSISLPAEEQLGLSLAEIKSFDRHPLHIYQDPCSDSDSQSEIFDTIEAGFVDENCNGGRYQLNKFPSVIDLNYIRHQRQLLGIQLSCVTNKLYTMIYQKQTLCAAELGKVLELQENLDSVSKTLDTWLFIYKHIFELVHFSSTSIGIRNLHQWTQPY